MGAVIRTVCNGLRRKLHAGLIIKAVVRIRGERSDGFLKLLGRPEGELLTGILALASGLTTGFTAAAKPSMGE